MKIKTFLVPVFNPEAAEEALNRFLASHRIVSVEKQLLHAKQNSCWSFVVTWLDGPATAPGKRPPVDYREVLDAEDFSRYAQLRELRNQLAKKEGKPAYAVFTNEQLAALVTQKVTSRSGMAAIPGIGESRITRYGEVFLALLKKFESSGKE